MHFVLFEHDHQDLDGPGRGGEDGETTLGGRALPKGMPPVPTGAMDMADAGAALVSNARIQHSGTYESSQSCMVDTLPMMIYKRTLSSLVRTEPCVALA